MKHFDPKTLAPARWLAVAAVLTCAWLTQPAMAQMPSPSSCGNLSNGDNGPFDFRNERRDLLKHGETFHFTPKVESLLRGESGYQVGNDISFLLIMFPNHPRALVAMMRWGEKLKTSKPHDTPYTVECYFERALRFRPDDNVARMIYALFLSKNSRKAEALQHLDRVSSTAGDNPFTHYNAGLLYFDIEQYDKALVQAQTALAMGFTRTDLKDKLKAAGKWVEPDANASAPLAPASAASAPS